MVDHGIGLRLSGVAATRRLSLGGKEEMVDMDSAYGLDQAQGAAFKVSVRLRARH
jgi:hypothetical protein